MSTDTALTAFTAAALEIKIAALEIQVADLTAEFRASVLGSKKAPKAPAAPTPVAASLGIDSNGNIAPVEPSPPKAAKGESINVYFMSNFALYKERVESMDIFKTVVAETLVTFAESAKKSSKSTATINSTMGRTVWSALKKLIDSGIAGTAMTSAVTFRATIAADHEAKKASLVAPIIDATILVADAEL